MKCKSMSKCITLRKTVLRIKNNKLNTVSIFGKIREGGFISTPLQHHPRSCNLHTHTIRRGRILDLD